MARVAVQLTNFTGGELSPRLDGRNDLTKYTSGCKTLENLIVYPHGAAARRPGTSFVAEVANSANKTRLIPFEFSTTQTYMLEFSNLKIRVFKDNGSVLEADKVITNVTQADPAVVTSNSHGYSNGDEVVITEVVGMTELNGKRFLVAGVTTNTFELTNKEGVTTDSTGFTTYVSDGVSNKVFEITTPYTTAQLFDIKFAQSADVMYITHPAHEASKLSRTGHTTWSLDEISFTNGPFMDVNTTTTTLTPSSASVGSRNITASAVTGINGGSGFISTDIGRQIHFNAGYGVITAITSTTIAVATITTAFTNANAITDWYLGSFSDTTGHPSCVTFFEQRLIFAGTTSEPQTILIQLAYQQEPNQIIYAARADGELVGLTYQREQQVTAWHRHIFGGIFGTTTITVTDYANITNGTRIVLNKSNGEKTTFTSATAVTAGLFHTTTSNNQTATNLKTLIDANTDFTATVSTNVVTITEVVSTGLGYLTASSFDTARLTATNQGKVVCESVAVIPTDDAEYQVWVIIKRTVNGITKRYVEYLNNVDFVETDNTSFNYLDSALSYSGTAVSTVSGLDHLEGQTVHILANGATHPVKVVTAGVVTLDRASTNVKVGLGYSSILQTMRLDAGSQNGTSQGKTKRIYDITVRLYESIGVEVGPNLSDMERIPFRTSADVMDQGIPTFTGDKAVEFRGNYDTDGFIFVRQTQPLPLTVLSLYPELQTND
jgi:hypothetical protein